jgi:hypothetical protein
MVLPLVIKRFCRYNPACKQFDDGEVILLYWYSDNETVKALAGNRND